MLFIVIVIHLEEKRNLVANQINGLLWTTIINSEKIYPVPWTSPGGTAFNGVVEELKKLTTCVAHVLPVSDDGGSTAEIVRVLGKFHQYMI